MELRFKVLKAEKDVYFMVLMICTFFMFAAYPTQYVAIVRLSSTLLSQGNAHLNFLPAKISDLSIMETVQIFSFGELIDSFAEGCNSFLKIILEGVSA